MTAVGRAAGPLRRVVVVGHGMVGSRFVAELVDEAADVQVTVLGAEEYEPYNRVLLSDVVAGKTDVASLTLPRTSSDPSVVRVLAGTTAVDVDRDRAVVLADDGSEHPYDVLVLATGASARIPQIPGLTGEALPAGVHALRTLDDAREIVAATVNARRAVVLGAGVLGLEAACGLARRGLAVTVVHRGAHLMDRQLDIYAADAVTHGLDRLGVACRTSATTQQVLVSGGALQGVRTQVAGEATPEALPAELLVVTAGTVPETGLARRAGLAVERGILVGDDGATSDPAVFAIGDCAQPAEGATGLIAQGWDQARRLARHLAGGPTATQPVVPTLPTVPVLPDGTGHRGTDVVRLKAYGLDVVAMGVCGSRRVRSADERTLRLSDPDTGRHVEVVVREGVVVGATCVGAGAVAADLTTAYTRQTPTPKDPAQLLIKPARGAASDAAEPSPTLMPHRATVCRCNGVTKGDIVGCWRHGARTVEQVAAQTRATTGCGGCTDAVCGIVDWLERTDPPAADGSREGDRVPTGAGRAVVSTPGV